MQVTVALEGLENILKVGETEASGNNHPDAPNEFAQYIDEAEGLDKIEALQIHPQEEIYMKAVKLVETYFGVEGEATRLV